MYDAIWRVYTLSKISDIGNIAVDVMLWYENLLLYVGKIFWICMSKIFSCSYVHYRVILLKAVDFSSRERFKIRKYI
jgi:hypothetical protein